MTYSLSREEWALSLSSEARMRFRRSCRVGSFASPSAISIVFGDGEGAFLLLEVLT